MNETDMVIVFCIYCHKL